jgi:HAD superfamily hydrolase (TIGR01509 family)
VAGRGEAALFTQLAWVRAEFLAVLGIEPYPGTLNALPVADDDRRGWHALAAQPGLAISPPDPAWCAARGYPVRLNGWLPAAAIVPEVSGYSPDQIELVAALRLRDALGLSDEDRLSIDVWRPPTVRAIIFDVDGTLVDSLTAFRVVAELTSQPHGFAITDQAIRGALNENRGFWDLVVPGDYPERANLLRALHLEAARRWPAVLREHVRLVPSLAETLRKLREMGAKLGIVSGARRDSLVTLREHGILEWFEHVVTQEDVVRRKPDPEGLLACAAALGVAPEEAVYVGDTPLDVRAARSAGMAVLAVLTGAGDSSLLSACGPDRILPSLAALPGAVCVVPSRAQR